MIYTPEEQKENRKKWVDALRLGEYKQAKQALKTDEGYCCLGVACDISGLGEWQDIHYAVMNSNGVLKRSAVGLPVPVMSSLGLSFQDGSWGFDDKVQSLSKLNDQGATFEEIANIIESEPENLVFGF